MQGSASLVVLFHYIAYLSAKIGALDPSNNRNRYLEILMQREVQASEATMLRSSEDFWSMNNFLGYDETYQSLLASHGSNCRHKIANGKLMIGEIMSFV